MREWSLTPEYILREWTEELLALMFKARLSNYQRQLAAIKKGDTPAPAKHDMSQRHVSTTEQFAAAAGFGGNIKIKRVRLQPSKSVN